MGDTKRSKRVFALAPFPCRCCRAVLVAYEGGVGDTVCDQQGCGVVSCLPSSRSNQSQRVLLFLLGACHMGCYAEELFYG